MGRRVFEDLKYRLCDELEELEGHSQWSAKDVEMIDRLTHSIKSIMAYLQMEESGDYEHNERSYARGGRRYYRGRSYDDRYYTDHNSYDDGRAYDDGMYRGRSRDDGLEKMTDELHELMEHATDSETKEAIKKTIAQVKKNK